MKKFVKEKLDENYFSKKKELTGLEKTVNDMKYNEYPADYVESGMELLKYAYNMFSNALYYLENEGDDISVNKDTIKFMVNSLNSDITNMQHKIFKQ